MDRGMGKEAPNRLASLPKRLLGKGPIYFVHFVHFFHFFYFCCYHDDSF